MHGDHGMGWRNVLWIFRIFWIVVVVGVLLLVLRVSADGCLQATLGNLEAIN